MPDMSYMRMNMKICGMEIMLEVPNSMSLREAEWLRDQIRQQLTKAIAETFK